MKCITGTKECGDCMLVAECNKQRNKKRRQKKRRQYKRKPTMSVYENMKFSNNGRVQECMGCGAQSHTCICPKCAAELEESDA